MSDPSPADALLTWLQTGANGPLVVVLLLMGWLWMLVRRRGDETASRPVRPNPLSLDELGRTAFKAAMQQDLWLWRDLFVNGAEARALLGEQATAFLETRSPDVLDGVLAATAAHIPAGATYGGVEHDATGGLALVVVLPGDGGRDLAPIGHGVQLGTIWRLWGGRPPSAA
jgi:hypothetical protein